jgi:hypothetical protein
MALTEESIIKYKTKFGLEPTGDGDITVYTCEDPLPEEINITAIFGESDNSFYSTFYYKDETKVNRIYEVMVLGDHTPPVSDRFVEVTEVV